MVAQSSKRDPGTHPREEVPTSCSGHLAEEDSQRDEEEINKDNKIRRKPTAGPKWLSGEGEAGFCASL